MAEPSLGLRHTHSNCYPKQTKYYPSQVQLPVAEEWLRRPVNWSQWFHHFALLAIGIKDKSRNATGEMPGHKQLAGGLKASPNAPPEAEIVPFELRYRGIKGMRKITGIALQKVRCLR